MRLLTAFTLSITLLSARPALAQGVKTIKPGMTTAEVKATWGAPLAERTYGNYTYLSYDNGCVKSCGTYDTVILEKGQVVDAIVRGSMHAYSGMSSSPVGRKPEATLP
ncbi:MAG: hypothetical protein ABJD11_12250 [Gemmatimonadota bacterium]